MLCCALIIHEDDDATQNNEYDGTTPGKKS